MRNLLLMSLLAFAALSLPTRIDGSDKKQKEPEKKSGVALALVPLAKGSVELNVVADFTVIESPKTGEHAPYIALTPDGKQIAVAKATGAYGDPGSVTIWDVATKQPVATLEGHKVGTAFVAYSSFLKKWVTTSFDGTIRIWDIAKPKAPDVLLSYSNDRSALDPTGRWIATAGSHVRNKGEVIYRIQIWDLKELKKAGEISIPVPPERFVPLAFSSDGKKLAAAWTDPSIYSGQIKVWDTVSQKELASETTGGTCFGISVHPNGKTLLATASRWHEEKTEKLRRDYLQFRNAETCKLMREVYKDVAEIACSPDGEWMVTRADALNSVGHLEFWSASASQETVLANGHFAHPVFNADGKFFAVVSLTKTNTDTAIDVRKFHVKICQVSRGK